MFTGCRISTMAVKLPSTGLATVDFGVMGIDSTESAVAYFTAPAAASSGRILAAVNGAMYIGGVQVAVVTSVDFTLTGTQKFAPYAILARELNQTKGTYIVGADGGQKRGTYLEVGATPTWPVGSLSFAIPLSAGFSLKNYYEANGTDHGFGFFDAGGGLGKILLGVAADGHLDQADVEFGFVSHK